MESFSSKLKKPGVKNWFKLCLSLSIVTEGLKDYTTTIVTYLHQQIYQACATTPNCKDNCFKTIGCKDRWCSTCISWKNEIMKYCRYKGFAYKIRWDLYDSNSLSHSPEELVKIFIPDWNATYKHYTLDISLVMSLFNNCKAFDIHTGDIAVVRKVRNEYVAHNQSMTVTDVQFEKSINRLGTFLHSKAIKETDTGSSALQMLQKVRSLDIINEIGKKGENFQFPLETCMKINEDMFKSLLDSQSQFQEEMRALITNPEMNRKNIIDTRYIGTLRFIFISLAVLAVLGVLIFGYCMGFLWTNPLGTKIIRNYTECEDMAYNYPWPSEIKFDGYIGDHDGFVGRDWLLKYLSNKMESSDKGIYLTAVMGYGKSALFSKILCSSQNSPGWNIRTKLLSFHICKFDVITTQKPDLFIRNIAGKIANYIPEYGNIILDDETVMRYLRGERCSEDPFGCLDNAVIDPLKRLINVPDKFLIAIDALDECVSMIENKSPSIPDVLSSRISRFPSWIRFLFTSRNISLIQNDFRMLNQLDLDPFDDRNLGDLQAFINEFIKRAKHSDSYINKYDSNVANAIQKVKTASKGNFLYMKHALIAWSKSGNTSLDNLPITLEDIYKRNFQRIFAKNGETFINARIVFEILCATTEPLLSEEVIEIGRMKSPLIEHSIINLLRNQMGHFLIFNGDYIQIAHKSITEWLTKADRKYSSFYISIKNGKKLFAEYMFGQMENDTNTTESKFFALVTYIADSKDKGLEDRFLHHVKTIFARNMSMSILHQAASSINHYRGFKMMYNSLSVDVDSIINGVTPLFVAASKGHYKTVKALLDLGANITFRKTKPHLHFNVNDAINYGKTMAFWGYNSLHIAAQNNHFETAKLLVQKNEKLLYTNNHFGLNPFQLAAERGNTEIMRLFLNKNKSFADDHSLYYASRNGHYKAVKLIIYHNVTDRCPRCDGSLYWLRNYAKRFQSGSNGYQYINISHVHKTAQQNQMDFIDDWRLLSCETALHAAISNCDFNVVKLLIKKFASTLDCTNFQGYSPLHFSVVYNCSDIFKLIVNHGSSLSKKCISNKHVDHLQMYKLNEKEKEYVQQKPCLKSPYLVHLLAQYDRYEMALFLHKRTQINWFVVDDDNCTALHYAACYSSGTMVLYLTEYKKLPTDSKSANGSTPFHSAVACHSAISITHLEQQSEKKAIQLLKDNDMRDILFYLFLSKSPDSPLTENEKNHKLFMLYFILKEIFEDNYDFYSSDSYGKTAINYAILNGYSHCLLWFYYQSTFKHIVLKWKDPYNKTVIDLSFEALKSPHTNEMEYGHRFQIHKNPGYDMSSYDSNAFSIAIILLKNSSWNLEEFESNVVILLNKAAAKGRYNVFNQVLNLAKHSNINYIQFLNKLLRNNEYVFLKPLQTYGYLSFNLINCSQHNKAFPLHKIVMNKNNKYWYYSPHHSTLLRTVLNKFSSDELNSCTDNGGYNLLHRAAMGGHLSAIKFLVEKGMDVKKKSSLNINSLGIVLLSAPWPTCKSVYLNHIKAEAPFTYYTTDIFDNNNRLIETVTIVNNITETSNYDLSAVLLLNAITDACQTLCFENINAFSPIHIASAKGLIEFVKAVHKKCGDRVLSCQNSDVMTPLLSANLLFQTKVVDYLETLVKP